MKTDMPAETRKCPDCGGTLERIRILDGTYPAVSSSGPSAHYNLTYAKEFAKTSWWSKRVEVAGHIHGYICGGCSRIFLYGEPVELDPLPGGGASNPEDF